MKFSNSLDPNLCLAAKTLGSVVFLVYAPKLNSNLKKNVEAIFWPRSFFFSSLCLLIVEYSNTIGTIDFEGRAECGTQKGKENYDEKFVKISSLSSLSVLSN